MESLATSTPHPPPQACDLPTLAFGGPGLALKSWNSSASIAFSSQKLSPSLSPSDVFHFSPSATSAGGGSASATALEVLADACSTGRLGWGTNTTTLDIFTHQEDEPTRWQSCVVIVQRTRPSESDSGFIVTLLHPSHPTPSPTSSFFPSITPPNGVRSSIEGHHLSSMPDYAMSSSSEDGSREADEEGQPTTDRKPTQRQLQDYLLDAGSRKMLAVSRLQKMMDSMAQVCFSLEPDGEAIYFNEQWYAYTGLARTARMDPSVFHPDDQAEIAAQWGACVASGSHYNMEYRVKAADGSWRWHLARARPIHDEEGRIESWVGCLTDVDELVKVKSDALQLQSHLRAVMYAGGLVLASVDSSSTVTFWEGSGLPVTADPVGQRIAEIWPNERLHRALQEILETGVESIALDVETSDSHTRCCLKYRLVPLKNLAGEITGAIIVCSDVTAAVLAEESLRQSAAERGQLIATASAAKEASRLKTEFITTVSHELRTPVAGVIGICELLLDDPDLDGGHRTLVEQARRSGETLLDLVGMVLDLRKIEAGQISLNSNRFSPRESLREAMDNITALAYSNEITLHLHIDEEIFEGDVIGDHLRFLQICSNGLSNAVKFSQTGGEIYVRLHQETESKTMVALRVEIQDCGVGISPAVLSTLFQPFMQAEASTSRRFGGSGLGLVISRQLAEILGGTVDLYSEEGVGTTMVIRLPFPKSSTSSLALRRPSCTLPAQISPTRRRNHEDISILIAEDNALLREIVTRTLVKRKFRVHGVSDGREAVRAAHEHHYDLIVMDIQMPGLDGLDATRQIRASADPVVAKVKCIALTANALVGDRERCISAGINGYLSKPVRGADLEAAIWELLDAPSL